jgi:REP element-mobilizing transposase RayT
MAGDGSRRGGTVKMAFVGCATGVLARANRTVVCRLPTGRKQILAGRWAAIKSLICVTLFASNVMPDHLHLLVWALQAKEDVSTLLARIQQPVSRPVRKDWEQAKSRLLQRLMVRERPGKIVFRYWQEGPGFDRNLLPEASWNEPPPIKPSRLRSSTGQNAGAHV